jgi:hypothetical protein
LKYIYARSIITNLFAIVYVVNIAFNINIKKINVCRLGNETTIEKFFQCQIYKLFPKSTLKINGTLYFKV